MAKRKKKPEIIINIKKSNIKTDLKPMCYGSWEECCIHALCGKWYEKCKIDTEENNDKPI